MATGIGTQLTRQIGEHLVTAELGRRGILASPFAGNVPAIDILAWANGISAGIQVKAINQNSWQFNIRSFLEIKDTASRQVVVGPNLAYDRKVVCIFVVVGSELGKDEFYLFPAGWLQDYFLTTYKGRKAPKNLASFRCAIWRRHVQEHADNWALLAKKFKLSSARG